MAGRGASPEGESNGLMEMVNFPKFCILSLLLILFMQSCSKAPAPIKNFPEANQKFLQLCKDEYHLDVVTKKINKTLWIYVPMKEPIIDYKGTKDGAKRSNKGTEKLSLQYVDGHYENEIFHFAANISGLFCAFCVRITPVNSSICVTLVSVRFLTPPWQVKRAVIHVRLHETHAS